MLWTSICWTCFGQGTVSDPWYPTRGCSSCNKMGLIPSSTYPYDVTKAHLCEVCGARAFGDVCLAPDSWHQAHRLYTETVRAGRVYVGWNTVPHHIWDGYDVKRFWRYPVVAGTRNVDPYYIELSTDELEDAHFKLQARGKRSKRQALERTLQAYRFVTAGMPWWLASTHAKALTLRDNLAKLALGYVQVNGYPMQRFHRNDRTIEEPCPVEFPPFNMIADVVNHRYIPHRWLFTAWARGITTHYPEAEYRALLPH